MHLSMPLRIAFWQLMIGIVGGLLWWVLWGWKAAWAALFGGGIGALLSLYVALRFSAVDDASPRDRVSTFYRAEVMKFVLAVVLFSIAALLFADVYIPLITTFIAGLTAYWVALLRIKD